jgi:hypothetical protein
MILYGPELVPIIVAEWILFALAMMVFYRRLCK